VSKVDLAARAVVQTVDFPAGSRPWMLRVSPDGKQVWVQTGMANTNVVLDAESLAVVQTTPAGKQPVEAAFQPGDGRYGLVTHFDDTFDRRSGQAVTRVEVGCPQANASFAPDGATAFVSVVGGDEVVAIDMGQLAVAARIKTGAQPMGLVLLAAGS
jgi:YVTN family beta-propeller protein